MPDSFWRSTTPGTGRPRILRSTSTRTARRFRSAPTIRIRPAAVVRCCSSIRGETRLSRNRPGPLGHRGLQRSAIQARRQLLVHTPQSGRARPQDVILGFPYCLSRARRLGHRPPISVLSPGRYWRWSARRSGTRDYLGDEDKTARRRRVSASVRGPSRCIGLITSVSCSSNRSLTNTPGSPRFSSRGESKANRPRTCRLSDSSDGIPVLSRGTFRRGSTGSPFRPLTMDSRCLRTASASASLAPFS